MSSITCNGVSFRDNGFRIPEIPLLPMKWYSLHTSSWHNIIIYRKQATIISQGQTQTEVLLQRLFTDMV
jgi:hypothetical protein